MRYWGSLAAKLGVLAGALYLLWALLGRVLPPPTMLYRGSFLFADLTWTVIAGIFFLICCGSAHIAILDQRYRCRVCLRRLRMPIAAGSWGQMLQRGRPRTEYICPYGHGTLKVAELQISGLEAPAWKAHDDMWTELFSLEESEK